MVMKIAGLQKVSTIDYPGEIACVVFLWGCNFRCGFCYNPDLVVKDCGDIFSEEYVLEFLSRRVGKLDAVVITGGEPLVSLDFDFVRKIKEMGFKVKLDTNGSFPDRLAEMIKEGLADYVAMDVKACREDYCKVAGAEIDLGKIEESMKLVNEFGKRDKEKGIRDEFSTQNHDVCDSAFRVEGEVGVEKCGDFRSEFRTTVVLGLHDMNSLVRMGKWMSEVCGGKPGRIFLQGFKANKEGMIDMSFLEKADVLEGELDLMKGKLDGLFGEVRVRV